MRWLTLLFVSIVIGLSGQAFAVPHDDAEQAYANGDYKTAFAIWLPLAEQGSALAQTNIARMYENGEWVAQDPAMAAEWYRRAADTKARDANPQILNAQQTIAQQTIANRPPPIYAQPVGQPAYPPLFIRPAPPPPPFFVPMRRHWRH
jgi:hypothetical protein